MLGDTGVGKTSLSNYICSNKKFYPESTIGVEFFSKIFFIEKENYNLKWTIWDTAGQERFRSLINTYFRNRTIYFIIYDVTNIDSFKNLDIWLENLQEHLENNLIYLIANKIDSKNRKISEIKGKVYANSNNLKYFELSVFNDNNIKLLINDINNNINKIISSNKRNYIFLKKHNISSNYKRINIEVEKRNNDKKCCIIN
jgi:small GTP-binding protein